MRFAVFNKRFVRVYWVTGALKHVRRCGYFHNVLGVVIISTRFLFMFAFLLDPSACFVCNVRPIRGPLCLSQSALGYVLLIFAHVDIHFWLLFTCPRPCKHRRKCITIGSFEVSAHF